jgi:hypothetical protein
MSTRGSTLRRSTMAERSREADTDVIEKKAGKMREEEEHVRFIVKLKGGLNTTRTWWKNQRGVHRLLWC